MNLLLLLCIVILVLVIVLSLTWRCVSRRRSVPCPVWMKWMLDPPFSQGMSGRTRKTIENLDITPGMQVLDAGCGPGRLSIPLAHITGPSGSVTAMDIQEGMLNEVRMRAEKENIANIRFLLGGLGEGKLEAGSYDRVVMITVLGEIPDREAAMKEIFSVLKSGGILLIEETIRDPHFQTVRTVRNFANNLGFVEKCFSGNRFSYTLLLEKYVPLKS
jgi:ubiquinone/menaquinone biosynthesis C-methylase UbiE